MTTPAPTLGNLRLATNLFLAPIAGYCDVSFRLDALSCGGVGLAAPIWLSPHGVLRENKRVDGDWPPPLPGRFTLVACSCMAAIPQLLCEAARWAEDRGAHVIDINMGCPVDKVTKRDGGSKLLCDPDRTLRMVDQIMAVSETRHAVDLQAAAGMG